MSALEINRRAETMQQPHNTWIKAKLGYGVQVCEQSGMRFDSQCLRELQTFSVTMQVQVQNDAKTLCPVRSPCFCNRPIYATAVQLYEAEDSIQEQPR